MVESPIIQMVILLAVGLVKADSKNRQANTKILFIIGHSKMAKRRFAE